MKNDGLTEIHGEASFALKSRAVEAFVTRRGGHLAPVRFRIGRRWAEPYALAPWKPDVIDAGMPPLLKVLRGDFFCLPFGSSPGIAEPHGETANAAWRATEQGPDRLVLDLAVQAPRCRVRKTLCLRPGHRAVYQEHRIQGLSGRFNFGHHAILQFPEKGGPFHVNVSSFRYGRVKPDAFSNPLAREYGALKTGARFNSLAKVALAQGGYTSLQQYPARQGFEDLILLASRPGDFAWTAATLDGYVWISLKDPRTLPATLFWLSNGGRHGPPWNGSHLRRLGLEEICGHYSDGLDISRRDLLKQQGIPTTRRFHPSQAVAIRVIHLVHPVPAGFGKVESITRDPSGSAVLVTGRGPALRVPVDWTFLHSQ